jgi:hypothetical protein
MAGNGDFECCVNKKIETFCAIVRHIVALQELLINI